MPEEKAIELVDRDVSLQSVPQNLRSIRFKKKSFEVISSKWNDFRKEASKVEEKSVNTEPRSSEVESHNFNTGMNEVSNGGEKVTNIVPRLEKKTNIIRNVLSSPKYYGDRVIKLKDYMIKNARFNSHSIYSTVDEAAHQEVVSMKEEEYVPSIKNNGNVRDDIIVVPDREAVQKTVDNEFSKKEEDLVRNVTAQEVFDITNGKVEEVANEEVTNMPEENTVVDKEQIRKAVDEAINGINVQKGTSLGAKLEKYTDLDDKETGLDELDTPKTEASNVIDFNNKEDVEFALNDYDTDYVDKVEMPFAESVIEDNNNNNNNQVRIDLDSDSIGAITDAVDKAESIDFIKSLRRRVEDLQQKQKASSDRVLEAEKQLGESENRKRAAIVRLEDYAKSLENDIDTKEHNAKQYSEKAKRNEELVEEMLSTILPPTGTESTRVR